MRATIFVESLALGFVSTLFLVLRPPRMFMRPPHARPNYRGKTVAGTLGVLLFAPLIGGGAIAVADDAPTRAVVAVLGAGVLFGVVGLIDDVYGDRHAGGLIGHARALVRGRVTTGTLKAVSGVGIGLGTAWIARRGAPVGLPTLVMDGAVVALAAHVVNLLDVRPGRALKAWLLGFAGLTAVARLSGGVLATTMLAGGAVGFLEPDLHERGMLGDVGAAILGGALGAAAIVSLSRGERVWSAGLLALIAVGAEVTSLSKVIQAIGPLRFLDQLGRRTS